MAGKHLLEVDTIDGDDIRLEATKARLVRGRQVLIGPKCEIERVEYSESLNVSEESTVGERVKR